MIVKHVPMKTVRKSNFRDLAQYLSDPKDRGERVGDIRITNCHADEWTDAAPEVMATQARNVRAKNDKTLHLIISFRAGEQPSEGTLAEIEQRICVELGFAEHQRISVTHHDTDNLHVHVAINKIHPRRITMHEPFRAYCTLAELCTQLESEFGLECDNHQANKRGAENRAADMEHAAGIESLLGWVKRTCLPQIQGASSWAELHRILDEHGLALRERGNGFVIQAGDGTTVKASSVSRDLGKAKLQERLGPFQPPPPQLGISTSVRQYHPSPTHSSIDTNDLYARYKREQEDFKASRRFDLAEARKRKTHEIEAAKQGGRLKRMAIRAMAGSGVGKKVLYALVHRTLQERIQKIQAKYRNDRQVMDQRYRRYSWNDWLQQQAKAGNKEALAALRARTTVRARAGNTVTAQRRHSAASMPIPDHVTKHGTLIYRIGTCSVRDDGHHLQVARGASQDGLVAVLQMATQRYGQTLSVSGTTEFKEQIARAATAANLPVRFSDPETEPRRLGLLAAGRNGQQAESSVRGVRR